MQKLTDVDLSPVKLKYFVEGRLGGMDAYIARTGFTGERGYEIFLPAMIAPGIWDSILKQGEEYGIKPAGLGYAHTVRLETCSPPYTNRMYDNPTPVEANLDKA